MARRARIVIPGWPHHVTRRGNHRQAVFFSDQDRIVYLDLMSHHFTIYELSLIGNSLMTNHVHFVIIPSTAEALSLGVGRLNQDYARLQNMRHGQTGHLWQNRFYSCPVEPGRIWEVLAYVELNPVRARLVDKAHEWKWSSAQAHVSGIDGSGLLDMTLWQQKRENGARLPCPHFLQNNPPLPDTSRSVARRAHIVIPGWPHQVFQRGNHRQIGIRRPGFRGRNGRG